MGSSQADETILQTFDQCNIIERIASYLAVGSAPALVTQALWTLTAILSRDDDFFSDYYRRVILEQFQEQIFERCEQIVVDAASTQEMFKLSVDITDKYLL